MSMGADLIVLAIDENRGTIREWARLGFAMAAAEIVDLAVTRRIGAAVNQDITVDESLRTGDPLLDSTLAAIAAEPAGHRVSGWVRRSALDRANQYVDAMLTSGELLGRAAVPTKKRPAVFTDLHSAGPARRTALTDRLIAIATATAQDESSLPDEAFAALAYAAGISDHVLGPRQRQARGQLKDLAGWFADTSRYLPDFQGATDLGDEDLAEGDVNPVAEEPWRLAIRLAVEEAVVKATGANSSPWHSTSGFPKIPWADEYKAYHNTPS